MPKLRNIVYLSEAQKQTLFTDGTITVGTTTVDYSDNDIYVVQQLWNTDGSNSNNYYIKDNTNTTRLTLSSSGMVTASGFSGSGASLTNLNADNISTGTINLLRLPAEVWTSYNLTNLNQLTNGPGYITSYTETDPIFSAWNKSTGISILTSQISDITATATEINKLDGFTGTYLDLNYAKDLRATGVTATEFDYIDGVTSNIQTQLNGKEPSFSKNTAFNKNYGTTASDVKMNGTQSVGSVDAVARIDHVHPVDTSRQAVITGGASTITSSNLTASRALISDTNGKVGVSATTSTQLGYLSGASSNIQSQLNGKIIYDDALMPRNSFGGRKLFTSHLDNAFFLLNERYTITAGFYNKTDDSLYSLATITQLFNSDYDGSVVIPLGTYLKLHISFAGSGYVYNGAECFPEFPYGKLYLSYYHTSFPESARFRVYSNYVDHGLGWSDYVNFGDFVNNGSTNRIQVATQSKYAISEMEIIVESPDTGLPTRLTQIDFALNRPTTQEMPVVSKFINQKIYKDLDFVGTGKPKVAGQEVYHPGNKPTPVEIGASPTVHTHTATNINSGRFTLDRLPTGLTGVVLKGNGINSNPVWGAVDWSEIVSKPTIDSANTASAIVARDASGNFSAGTITANITGTASGNLTSSSTLNATKLSGAIPVAVTQTEWDSAYTDTNSATSSNTINTIVKRDGSGNFSAGTITANLTGTASGNLTSSSTLSASKLSGRVALGNLPITGAVVGTVLKGNGTNSPVWGTVAWDEVSSKPTWIDTDKPTYTWSEIGSKPTWIGSSKPSYSWSEIGSKPTNIIRQVSFTSGTLVVEVV